MSLSARSNPSSHIRIGVMGCAQIASRSVVPALKALPEEFELVAAASREQSKAQAFAGQFGCAAVLGYQRLLERPDIDAIYLPLPAGLHDEWILRTLEAGKHVLAEKPLSGSLASVERILAKARERNLLVMENFMFCHHSQHQFVRGLLNDGQVGELRLLRSSFGFPPLASDNFRYSQALGGGALLDVGVYTLKATQLFLSGDIRVLGVHLNMDTVRNIDLGGAAILCDSGGLAAQVAFGFDHFYQCNYELWGSLGKITVERAFTAPPGFSPRIILEKQGKREVFTLDPDNHFHNILRQFARAVDNRMFEPYWDAALKQARLIQQILEFSL